MTARGPFADLAADVRRVRERATRRPPAGHYPIDARYPAVVVASRGDDTEQLRAALVTLGARSLIRAAQAGERQHDAGQAVEVAGIARRIGRRER